MPSICHLLYSHYALQEYEELTKWITVISLPSNVFLFVLSSFAVEKCFEELPTARQWWLSLLYSLCTCVGNDHTDMLCVIDGVGQHPKVYQLLANKWFVQLWKFFLHLTTQHQFSSFYRYSNLQEELWRSKHTITRSCSTVLCYLISTNDAYSISASTLDSVQCFSLDWLLRNIQLHTIRSLLL